MSSINRKWHILLEWSKNLRKESIYFSTQVIEQIVMKVNLKMSFKRLNPSINLISN